VKAWWDMNNTHECLSYPNYNFDGISILLLLLKRMSWSDTGEMLIISEEEKFFVSKMMFTGGPSKRRSSSSVGTRRGAPSSIQIRPSSFQEVGDRYKLGYDSHNSFSMCNVSIQCLKLQKTQVTSLDVHAQLMACDATIVNFLQFQPSITVNSDIA